METLGVGVTSPVGLLFNVKLNNLANPLGGLQSSTIEDESDDEKESRVVGW